MNISKITKFLCAFGCLVFSTVTLAIPTLDFIGELAFDSTTGILTVTGEVNGASAEFDAIQSEVLNSSLTLSIELDPASVTANTVTNPLPPNNQITTIVANFNSGAGTDLQITNLTNTLLAGNVVDPLIMAGTMDGSDGNLSGEFLPTAGDLLTYFTLPSSIFALELNLTALFTTDMFNSDFTGQANGSIAAIAGNPVAGVPEPPVWALFAIALSGFIAVRQRRPFHNKYMF